VENSLSVGTVSALDGTLVVDDLIIAYVKKTPNKNEWCIYSKSGKKMGCYKTKDEAVERLRQIEYFKHNKANEFIDVDDVIASFVIYNLVLNGSEIDVCDYFDEYLCGCDELAEGVDVTENYLRFRQTEPDKYDSFRIINISVKQGIKAVLGIINGPPKKTEIQSYLFDKSKWTTKDATKWIKDHGKKASASANSNMLRIKFNVSDVKIEQPDAVAIANIDSFFDEIDKNRQKDLMYIAFKLVHEGTNANLDHFLYDELKSAQKTPINKPLNWLHWEPNIGVIYDATLVDATDIEGAYIEAHAVVWKYKYRDYAMEIENRHSEGELFFSMEVWYSQSECPICKKTYSAREEAAGKTCEHLASRFYERAEDPNMATCYRILRGLTFGGAAVVDLPADKGAEALAVASKNKADSDKEVFDAMKRLDDGTLVYTEAEIEELKDKVRASVREELSNEGAHAKELEDRDKQIADLQKTIEGLNTELAEAQKKLDETIKEFDEHKSSIEKEKLVAKRTASLIEAGYQFSQDEKEKEAVIASFVAMDENAFEFVLKTIKDKNEEVAAATASRKTGGVPVGSTVTSSGGTTLGQKMSKIKDLLTKV
jgi:hypothetical protein